MGKCKCCAKEMFGRRDKIFCDVKCKNTYHKHMRYQSVVAAIKINEYLKRNYRILKEILGENNYQIKVNRCVLEDKKFRFKYHTHSHTNTAGKRMNYIYDFGWMEFSTDEILVVKAR
jgi:hypothetical protein